MEKSKTFSCSGDIDSVESSLKSVHRSLCACLNYILSFFILISIFSVLLFFALNGYFGIVKAIMVLIKLFIVITIAGAGIEIILFFFRRKEKFRIKRDLFKKEIKEELKKEMKNDRKKR